MKNEYKIRNVNLSAVSRFNSEIDLYLKREREKGKRINQRIIADKLGVKPQFLCNLKSGKRRLTTDMAEKVGELFQVYPRYLLGLSDERHYTRTAFDEETKLLFKRDDFAGKCLKYFEYEFLNCNIDTTDVKYTIKTPEDTEIVVTHTRLEELAEEILSFVRVKLSYL